MSRALDKSVIASLDSGDSAAAYEAISQALVGIQADQQQQQQQQHEELLEIEILGKSHPLEPGNFLLQDGNAIAVSKIGLVQAFFVARKKFQDYIKSGGSQDSMSPDELLAVTSVMLLMDPEHLTAANARKRLLISEASMSREGLLSMMMKDRCFVDSLLTSRLHRHTKSPTLWSHRRWLAQTASHHGVQANIAEVVKHVVMIAGERHPRNYYAWCHARWLTGLASENQERATFEELVDITKDWCFRNHTDTSGWSFLYFLLMRLGGSRSSAVLEEAAGLATSLQWTNESTWVFLRTLAASGVTGEKGLALFDETREALLQRVENTEGRRVLEEACSWSETYRRRPS
ncbi:Protein prenyltransferase alpha subunit repeat-containing protein 1 [Cytospora mali]|uniref:Protein prenyltransferase alpha subunit repeat-containing protein 1 n=1 Tax=Cytospora mali TaxID=578113 RepID=A0A194V1E2_CYTMA|nr:Protein prenyltransferase alpha subunit repeat-containing protein 1 [Valsa mali var. pyri (nom. inval.)]